MIFFKKTIKKHNIAQYGLDVYNTKENEPTSSVIESSDYDFATLKYSKKDFRYQFVENYIKYMMKNYGVTIFNCKFERPCSDSDFVNLFIYLWEDDPDIKYRIENSNNNFVVAFYEILNSYNLPAITKETRIQFIVKNIRSVMEGRCLNSTWYDIHNSIKITFPEIAELSYFAYFYLFIEKDKFDILIKNTHYLEKLKRYCFDAAKKHDINNILEYTQFHIRIDNYENYLSIGGQHYFNSDLMFDCLLL